MAYYLGREKKASALILFGKSERQARFWDLILQDFVNANGNDQGRNIQSLSTRFNIIHNSCLRYNEILKDNNMDIEVALIAYVVAMGCEFKFSEAYEVLYRCIC
ncbi:hypothetical protein MKX01_022406 [Papaver californicum]|nr:hypothetical protein MKX01_022406 [Papaver californicum]